MMDWVRENGLLFATFVGLFCIVVSLVSYYLGFGGGRRYQREARKRLDDFTNGLRADLREMKEQELANPPKPKLRPLQGRGEAVAASESDIQNIRAELDRMKNMGCRFQSKVHEHIHLTSKAENNVFATRHVLYGPRGNVLWETWYGNEGTLAVHEVDGYLFLKNVAETFVRITWPDTQLRFLQEAFA